MSAGNIYQPLQRRMRRRSDHVSPTSPSYTRRFNRHGEPFSPTDAPPLIPESDQRSPRPRLTPAHTDFYPAQAPLSPHQSYPPTDSFPYQRSSEDATTDTVRPSEDVHRPATSDANRSAPYTATLGARPSPVSVQSNSVDYKERSSFEPISRVTDNTSSPTLRNYSFSSPPQDRSHFDDHAVSKGSTAKKSRLNLLNPMSLLARRRSSQNQKLDDFNLTINTLSVPALPDNFEPSIRGKLVHDFSAPRSRRQVSQSDVSFVESPGLRTGGLPDSSRLQDPFGGRNGPLSGVSNASHSPMFKENFQDDQTSLQPERTGYLHNHAAYNRSFDSQDPTNIPAFAKRLPAVVPQSEVNSSLLETDHQAAAEIPLAEPSPPPPSPPPKSTPSPKFEPPPPAALPKHMTSTSSRFSFQMGGSGSSVQERLLEEKHKQHEATRKPPVGEVEEEEDDDYANYDFDADDGFEEEIPSFNADLYHDGGSTLSGIQNSALIARYPIDEDPFDTSDLPQGNLLAPKYLPSESTGVPEAEVGPEPVLEPNYATSPPSLPESVIKETTLHRHSLQGFHFTPQSLTFSPTSTNNASQPTPRDHEGFPIGIADSRVSSRASHDALEQKDAGIEIEKLSLIGGLGITTPAARPRRRSNHVERPHAQVFDDDDLYFDDGEFGDLGIESIVPTFDEQTLDDESGQIRNIPAENARKLALALHHAVGNDDGKLAPIWDGPTAHAPQDDLEWKQHDHQRQVSDSSLEQGNSLAGLTETNLAAYHDALAMAANQAAVEGRFDRKVSFSQNSDDTSQSFENSRQGIVSADSRFGFNYNMGIAEDDGFPFDDDMDDDPMIAEANAEALENDEDGFYGQEFGFYARSNTKSSTEIVNGGYFGERGSSGVKRSHSGKANFQEPSLTPITERSEWSTRNSVVSLQMPGGIPGSAQSIPSPGIAQLLELDSPGYDEDMSFSALMRLRGRAFGGSSSSLNSGGGPPQISSPLAYPSHHPFGHGDHHGVRMSSGFHGRSSPVMGIPESEEEDEEDGRPTLTQNTPRKRIPEPLVFQSQEDLPSSPMAVPAERRKGHHSRNSSGAESVSYQREMDGRWVLERRRTDEETGDETVDREYLAGTRI
ncbi:hypothetical protein PV10_01490 [Exophiala mesophila]|uniref:AGC-kinase C-terminal domain-containing protein n=1 Tax=Exophiala mesophila TaxID=212818 RepID=A0A0D1ZT69_EXOME|nr:uncharacterized protein PV10_01490 [Exophiala mesophila]KIV97782.1 hypothetical protein PV10_01490 [Exophiala mesophila]